MEGYGQHGRCLQELRFHSPGNTLSTPETLAIPARWDAEAGCHIILLDDVQLVFKHARHFLDNGEIVPFIKDNNSHELVPLRIECRHGVILEVLETDAGEGSGSTSDPSITSSGFDVIHHNNGTESLPQCQQLVEELVITDGAASRVRDTASACCMDSPLLTHINHSGSYFKDIMSSREVGMSRVQNSMRHLVESMAQEISEDQDQMLQMSELVHKLALSDPESQETQSNKQEKERNMLEKQQQILLAQQQDINRLAAIQENVQDAAAMVFTALEHPFHHLFVVLPSGYESRSYNSFRLFFLCEHGHQSTTGNRSSPPNIHLARHEGYELHDIDEFFQDYTPFLVSIFHILKNGITSPRLNIPRLSHMTLADGVVEVQNILNLSNTTTQSLMNETISHLHNQGYHNSMKGMNSSLALDVIESTDPRSVLKYLKRCKRNGHTLGNLYQIVTSEKNVKWVCADHYCERYRGVAEECQDEKDTDELFNDSMDEEIQSLGVRSPDELAEASFQEGLHSMEWTVRERTVIALNRRVERDETVLQAIIGAVADPDKDVREAAVRVLHDSSKVSGPARDAVISAVYDTQWNVQEAAVQVLGDLPQSSMEMANFIDILGYAAESDHQHVKGAAMDALIRYAASESVLQYLVEAIRSDIHARKVVATEVLAAQTILPEAVVEALISTLRNDSQEVRKCAGLALQSQRSFSGSAIVALLEKVQDDTPHVKEAVMRVLSNQLFVPKALLSALIAGLQDESSDVQAAAVQALSDKSDLPQPTIQELTSMLFHERVSVREASAKVLAGQGALSEVTIQALTATLKDETPSVREAAVQAIGVHVQYHQSASYYLVRMLEDNDSRVRGAAAHSLGRRTNLPDSMIQALFRTLNDREVDVQEKAIQALGGLAASSSEAVETLLKFLENKNEAIRNSTIIALSSDVRLSDATIRKLANNLQDKRSYVRAATVRVLGNHVKWSESAAEALASAVFGEDVVVRRLAVSALRNQAKLPEAAVLTLTAAIKGNNQLVKLDVIRVLGEQVNSSEAAVETLICSICDPYIHVRRSAKEALYNLTQLSESSARAFERVLNDEVVDIRISALDVLSDHIRSSESAALVTLRSLRDTDQRVKDTALKALRNGLPESTVLLLIERLKDNDRTTIDEAFNVLAGLPNMPGYAVQKLIEYLEDDDKEIRRDAAGLLAGQARCSMAAAKALTNALKEEDLIVRSEAIMALSELAEFSEAMIQDQIDALRDDDSMVSQPAAILLERQTTLPEFAVTTLANSLKDQRTHVRFGAHTILRRQRKLPGSVTEALTATENDSIFSDIPQTNMAFEDSTHKLLPRPSPVFGEYSSAMKQSTLIDASSAGIQGSTSYDDPSSGINSWKKSKLESESSPEDNGMHYKFGTDMPTTVNLKSAIDICDTICQFALHYASQDPEEEPEDISNDGGRDPSLHANLQTIRNLNMTMLTGLQPMSQGLDSETPIEGGDSRQPNIPTMDGGQGDSDDKKVRFGKGPPSHELVHELAKASTSIFQLSIRLRTWVGMTPEQRELDEEVNTVRGKRCLLMDGTFLPSDAYSQYGSNGQDGFGGISGRPLLYDPMAISTPKGFGRPGDIGGEMKSQLVHGKEFSQNRTPFESHKSTASSHGGSKDSLGDLRSMSSGRVPGSDEKYQKYRKRAKRSLPPGRCQSCDASDSSAWRRGPNGASTLCNACGLHYAKLMRRQHQPRELKSQVLQIKPRISAADKVGLTPITFPLLKRPDVVTATETTAAATALLGLANMSQDTVRGPEGPTSTIAVPESPPTRMDPSLPHVASQYDMPTSD